MVKVQHAGAVGAVGQNEDTMSVGHLRELFDGGDEPRDEHGVADTDDLRPRGDRTFEGIDEF